MIAILVIVLFIRNLCTSDLGHLKFYNPGRPARNHEGHEGALLVSTQSSWLYGLPREIAVGMRYKVQWSTRVCLTQRAMSRKLIDEHEKRR